MKVSGSPRNDSKWFYEKTTSLHERFQKCETEAMDLERKMHYNGDSLKPTWEKYKLRELEEHWHKVIADGEKSKARNMKILEKLSTIDRLMHSLGSKAEKLETLREEYLSITMKLQALGNAPPTWEPNSRIKHVHTQNDMKSQLSQQWLDSVTESGLGSSFVPTSYGLRTSYSVCTQTDDVTRCPHCSRPVYEEPSHAQFSKAVYEPSQGYKSHAISHLESILSDQSPTFNHKDEDAVSLRKAVPANEFSSSAYEKHVERNTGNYYESRSDWEEENKNFGRHKSALHNTIDNQNDGEIYYVRTKTKDNNSGSILEDDNKGSKIQGDFSDNRTSFSEESDKHTQLDKGYCEVIEETNEPINKETVSTEMHVFQELKSEPEYSVSPKTQQVNCDMKANTNKRTISSAPGYVNSVTPDFSPVSKEVSLSFPTSGISYHKELDSSSKNQNAYFDERVNSSSEIRGYFSPERNPKEFDSISKTQNVNHDETGNFSSENRRNFSPERNPKEFDTSSKTQNVNHDETANSSSENRRNVSPEMNTRELDSSSKTKNGIYDERANSSSEIIKNVSPETNSKGFDSTSKSQNVNYDDRLNSSSEIRKNVLPEAEPIDNFLQSFPTISADIPSILPTSEIPYNRQLDLENMAYEKKQFSQETEKTTDIMESNENLVYEDERQKHTEKGDTLQSGNLDESLVTPIYEKEFSRKTSVVSEVFGDNQVSLEHGSPIEGLEAERRLSTLSYLGSPERGNEAFKMSSVAKRRESLPDSSEDSSKLDDIEDGFFDNDPPMVKESNAYRALLGIQSNNKDSDSEDDIESRFTQSVLSKKQEKSTSLISSRVTDEAKETDDPIPKQADTEVKALSVQERNRIKKKVLFLGQGFDSDFEDSVKSNKEEQNEGDDDFFD